MCLMRCIAASGSDLFVLNPSTGTVAEYTTSGATVNATLVTGVGAARALAVSGNDLFVSNIVSGTIGEYDATTGAVINAAFVTGLTQPIYLAASDGELFALGDPYDVLTIGAYDATTGATINASLVTGLGTVAQDQPLTVAGGDIFVINNGGVSEYSAVDGTTINATLVPSSLLIRPQALIVLPEPGSWLLLAIGGGGALFACRRQRRARPPYSFAADENAPNDVDLAASGPLRLPRWRFGLVFVGRLRAWTWLSPPPPLSDRRPGV